jgi:hypothetical protein
VQAEGGRVIKETGDGLLATFGSAQRAARCAIAIQSGFADRAAAVAAQVAGESPDRPLEHRVALHLGEVEVLDGDVYGDGVNVCARLLEHAQPHGIVMSEQVYSLVKLRLPMAARRLGRLKLQNVNERVTGYQLRFRGTAAAARAGSVPTAPSHPALPRGNWYCPICAYNLRGREAGCCPECGWEYDAELRGVSLVPWVHRARIGRIRALLRTAWMVTRHPSQLGAELHRPITLGDAAAFARVVLGLVIVSVPLAQIAGAVIAFVRTPVGPASMLLLVAAGILVITLAIAIVLICGAMAATLIFRAPDLSSDEQNRLTAIGRYAVAPLLLLILIAPVDALLRVLPNATPAAVNWTMLAGLVAILALHVVICTRVRWAAVPPRRAIDRFKPPAMVAAAWLAGIAIIALPGVLIEQFARVSKSAFGVIPEGSIQVLPARASTRPATTIPSIPAAELVAATTRPTAFIAASDRDALNRALLASNRSAGQGYPLYAVQGVVKAVTRSATGRVTTIEFEGADPADGFIAVYFPALFAEMDQKFGGPVGRGLVGHSVLVAGALRAYRDHVEIVLESTGQLLVQSTTTMPASRR